MSTVYGFNKKEDLERVLRMAESFESGQSRSVVSPSHVRQEAKYAKILTVLNNSGNAEHDDKEATGVEVVWDKDNFKFKVVDTNPVTYDDTALQDSAATVFSTNNITSKSAMKVNDIVLLQQYPHLSDTSGWLVVETGGGGTEFGTCTIVSEIENPMGSGSQYVANVKPGNPQLSQSGTVPKGVVYLKFGTTTPVAVGAKLFTALYPSTQPVPEGEEPEYKYDCIPIETLYNLISPPEEEP